MVREVKLKDQVARENLETRKEDLHIRIVFLRLNPQKIKLGYI
jgi:chaperonin cofactor prefoldin